MKIAYNKTTGEVVVGSSRAVTRRGVKQATDENRKQYNSYNNLWFFRKDVQRKLDKILFD